MEIGYALSSEEHAPNDLVRYARQAEDSGFAFAAISDHFHPWLDDQGQSPFVWSVLGGIAATTRRLRVGTGVTCPTVRIHPAIIAQAAATTAAMMPGRFVLGVGTGENLNEHILGDGWPGTDERLAMLEEAVAVIRRLWEGDLVTFEGDYYTVDRARLYTLPDELPPIVVAASGEKAAGVAGRIGDGLWSVAPDRAIVDAFQRAGGRGPRYGQVTVCWAESDDDAKRTAHQWWRSAGVPGELSQELPVPAHFEQAAELVSPDQLVEKIVCGPDPEAHLETVGKFTEAGFDHVYVHQVGPDQEGFFEFYRSEVLPKL